MPDPTPTPVASPTVSSTIGLKNVVIAPLTADTETAHTYGSLQLVAGAIEATVTPNNTDPDVQYVLIRSAPDKPPYFACGFKSEKSNHKFRYVWLYKCRAKPVTETYSTKEGDKVTRQTGEVEFTAIKRTHDGRYQAVADEGENSFDATAAASFLTHGT